VHSGGQGPKPYRREGISAAVDEKHELTGVEVKYFREASRYSFAEGIGQAISYLSLGLDIVELWHFYDVTLAMTKLGCMRKRSGDL